ncbi:MAG TPA: DUF177 domain-containing protein [Paracoccus sp.]|nr:DUF177 domain-containing protein [Paracoccus sp. (in: a-proteobacteria)]
MTAPAQPSASQPQRLRVAHLDPRGPTDFALRPAAEARAAIAAELNILALPGLAFEGRIRAEGGQAWALSGRLTAQVVQSCVVTLKPVKTRIEEDVRRLYSPHLRDPEGDEVEMPDETLEPLGQFIDLSAVMIEELALSLPDYPRAQGAELTPDARDDDGRPETRRPFEGLDRLMRGDGDVQG